jgi:hypothetical protein
MGFQVDRVTNIVFFVLVKGGRQKGSQVNPTATPSSALVKGNCHMGFQVDRVTNIVFFVLVKGGRQKGSQVNPTVTLISALVKGNR